MNNSARNRTLIFIIALLLITNLALLAYTFFFSKKPHPEREREGFTAALKNEVGFTDSQIEQFKQLKQKQWAGAKADMEQIRKIKQQLFDLTRRPVVADSTVEALADSIATLQKQAEVKSFHHFKATRAICTPEQQPKYDSLMTKIIRQGRNGRPIPPGPSNK
ncbi:Spy/CpxP family protein refolding chaperone [Niabella drilacis]|uniref:LTXXQ motif family protein n=1 Tax=Niabella drilacis (strain DSM 25811 / CCM 8410 / CCUG 62505 / LMG 26954 / E90) TaxID=1285928 RepID=A0A1G6Q4V5_NIADE|nr:Spy/CpxP family protein refolding chaperone [Niabella drilacis]SDC87383.1 LTXXQ motif family protein [Niabella drilacis]